MGNSKFAKKVVISFYEGFSIIFIDLLHNSLEEFRVFGLRDILGASGIFSPSIRLY